MSGCGCVHISMYVFNFSVLIPFLCSSESIVSLMNTMCLSSWCTWEKFIRSCQSKMKTPPHETCHCLKWTQNDFLFVSACESSLLLWGRIPIPDATTHTHATQNVLVWLIIVFLLRTNALAGNDFAPGQVQI